MSSLRRLRPSSLTCAPKLRSRCCLKQSPRRALGDHGADGLAPPSSPVVRGAPRRASCAAARWLRSLRTPWKVVLILPQVSTAKRTTCDPPAPCAEYLFALSSSAMAAATPSHRAASYTYRAAAGLRTLMSYVCLPSRRVEDSVPHLVLVLSLSLSLSSSSSLVSLFLCPVCVRP